MSDHVPGPHDGAAPPAQPVPTEYLGDAAPPRHGTRRWGLVGGAAVVVVGVAAAAAWGVAQFMGAGPSPATAAPANTLAYVGVDLDPSGGQKIEALRTLRKFPALEHKLGLGSGDDLRRALLERLLEESTCPGLSYADDIEPWIGDKAGIGAVPGDDAPVPFGIVQVTDEDKARKGIAALQACDDGQDTDGGPGTEAGVAFVGDYAVIAETDKAATGIVADVRKGSLSDDATYQKWVGEAGGDGILTAYVSPAGARAALDGRGLLEGGLPTSGDPGAAKALADFRGGALVARFADQSLQVEMAAGGLPNATETDGDSGVTDLPSSTAVALGFGVGDTFAQDLLDGLRRSVGDDEVDQVLAEVEQSTGLSLPDDLQTLLGDGVAVAVDSSIDVGPLVGGSPGTSPADLPLGIRINGDPDKVMPVLQKVLDATGADGQGVVTEQGSHAVAVGMSAAYLDRLAADGDLGGQARFQKALPDLEDGAGALFVDFDAGDWLVRTLDDAPDSADLRANLRPLSALGITGTSDGSTVHVVLRLSTD